MNKECEKCFKRKMVLSPNSKLWYSTKDKTYFLPYEEALKIIEFLADTYLNKARITSKISDEATSMVRKEFKNDTSK